MADRFKTEEQPYAAQSTDLLAYLRANKTRFKLSDAQLTELEGDVTPFPIALTDYQDFERQKLVKSAIKDATFKASRKELGRALDNLGDLFTNEDRISNGMAPLSSSHSKRPIPTETPLLVLNYGSTGEFLLDVLDRDKPGVKGKPADCDDCEIRWETRDADFSLDPDDWHAGPTPSDLRSAIPIKMKPALKGKTIAFVGRFRNTSGDGPWSEIVEKTLV